MKRNVALPHLFGLWLRFLWPGLVLGLVALTCIALTMMAMVNLNQEWLEKDEERARWDAMGEQCIEEPSCDLHRYEFLRERSGVDSDDSIHLTVMVLGMVGVGVGGAAAGGGIDWRSRRALFVRQRSLAARRHA